MFITFKRHRKYHVFIENTADYVAITYCEAEDNMGTAIHFIYSDFILHDLILETSHLMGNYQQFALALSHFETISNRQ